jgi:hypothetical protein
VFVTLYHGKLFEACDSVGLLWILTLVIVVEINTCGFWSNDNHSPTRLLYPTKGELIFNSNIWSSSKNDNKESSKILEDSQVEDKF